MAGNKSCDSHCRDSGSFCNWSICLPHRGTYLVIGDQWRRLPVASAGGTPDPSEAIPLAGGVSCGRSGGDCPADQLRSGAIRDGIIRR